MSQYISRQNENLADIVSISALQTAARVVRSTNIKYNSFDDMLKIFFSEF
jgi:hypothetical protein